MLTPDKKSETLCLALWTHTYLSPQTERRLCCASNDGFKLRMKIADLDYKHRQNFIQAGLKLAKILEK
jgi:hypothetical protein